MGGETYSYDSLDPLLISPAYVPPGTEFLKFPESMTLIHTQDNPGGWPLFSYDMLEILFVIRLWGFIEYKSIKVITLYFTTEGVGNSGLKWG